MEKLTLTLMPEGKNELVELRNQLNNFVLRNFALLYEGAVRLGCEVEEDYYTVARVQINKTRLHKSVGLKYADGHKYSWQSAPRAEQIRQAVADIQALLDAAAQEIKAPFIITISELN